MMILLGALLATGADAAAPMPEKPLAALVTPASKPAAPVAAVRPSHDQVLAAVRSEWPTYDHGNKGRLTPLEFSTWVMQAHGATVAPRVHGRGIAPVSAMNASATAFARADLNHDGGITPDEMTRFLMTPPAPTALARAKAVAKPAEAVAGN
jgi:hypothetical protein